MLHAEGALRVHLRKVEVRVRGDVLEEKALQAELGVRVGGADIDVDLAERVQPGVGRSGSVEVVADGGNSVVPVRELRNQPEAVLEVRSILQEPPPIVHQAVRLGAGAADLAHRLHLGDALGLGVEVGGAREFWQLGLHVAHAERGALHLRRDEGLELELRRARLRRAVRVDRRLYG